MCKQCEQTHTCHLLKKQGEVIYIYIYIYIHTHNHSLHWRPRWRRFLLQVLQNTTMRAWTHNNTWNTSMWPGAGSSACCEFNTTARETHLTRQQRKHTIAHHLRLMRGFMARRVADSRAPKGDENDFRRHLAVRAACTVPCFQRCLYMQYRTQWIEVNGSCFNRQTLSCDSIILRISRKC